ncbi:probable glycosyltransferase At5g03795 [Cannabis sativa]|uniref:probable glycosyltransferase At5g03795 n=1 Tax=Cannabis sativa TaxID=3483 RepID=UPI0029CA8F6F|nr:probable glycosyltransferase At5g03795 [Cannabis sativa]XP_060963305.1 probable glycosyltransferase At5g03795 [Cannabis sativa]
MKLFTKCQAETRRLIWTIGVMFSLVLIFQYFELPFGIFIPSLFPSVKVPLVEESKENGDLLPNHKIIDHNNSSIYNASNSNDTYLTQLNDTRISGSTPKESLDFEKHNKTDVDHGKINTTNSSFSVGSPPQDNSNTSLVVKKESPEPVHTELKQKGKTSSTNTAPKITKKPETPVLDVYSVSDMNKLLVKSQASYYSVIPKWPSATERELQAVTLQIENAPIVKNDPKLYAPLYRNVSIFKRSYELMEQTLKIYIYKEGDRPILHTPVLTGIYASEGWFMKQLENNRQFVTKNPRKAHMFYLPFSSRMLEETLYVVDSHSHKNLIQFLKNYLDIIATKYPYWNRTGGADHFLVACHDWAPSETKRYMGKCIRALCNADVKEGFVFGKDVSLPETYVHSPKDVLRNIGGKPASKRSTLAFFAGSMHGYVRPILLQHWENKDPDMKIFGKLPRKKGNKVYVNYMKSSKYCICAKGYEVNSPRVVEAIFYDCVPVIISDNFVPPFLEVLNWESFAVFVPEKDIPNLKNILVSISDRKYRRLQMMVKKVQKHFLWNPKPVKYDIFHMILHSIWYNRLHQIRPM